MLVPRDHGFGDVEGAATAATLSALLCSLNFTAPASELRTSARKLFWDTQPSKSMSCSPAQPTALHGLRLLLQWCKRAGNTPVYEAGCVSGQQRGSRLWRFRTVGHGSMEPAARAQKGLVTHCFEPVVLRY